MKQRFHAIWPKGNVPKSHLAEIDNVDHKFSWVLKKLLNLILTEFDYIWGEITRGQHSTEEANVSLIQQLRVRISAHPKFSGNGLFKHGVNTRKMNYHSNQERAWLHRVSAVSTVPQLILSANGQLAKRFSMKCLLAKCHGSETNKQTRLFILIAMSVCKHDWRELSCREFPGKSSQRKIEKSSYITEQLLLHLQQLGHVNVGQSYKIFSDSIYSTLELKNSDWWGGRSGRVV